MKEALFNLSVVFLAVIALVVTACSSSSTPETGEQKTTEEQSLEIAHEYVENSETYAFDGIRDTLELTETLYPDIEYSWQFVFEFDSRNAGYGNRSDQVLAQVITPHEAIITVENGNVRSAVLDGKWDMIDQQSLEVDDNPSQTGPTKETSQQIALDYLLNSATYLFDGIDGSVQLTETITARCPYCWVFIYEFQSRHAGYGDRTGQILAQVITPHTASITVERGKVTHATIDGEWNMMNHESVNEPSPVIMTVDELMNNPQYETTVTVQGEVSLLGELFCPCFELSSGNAKVQVWYGLMVDDNGTELPSVDIEGINNGYWVKITGKLKKAGTHSTLNDFWAESISIIDRPAIASVVDSGDMLVGGTPGSCGYSWDADRYGWHRVWEEDSFIPADQKPEWEKYIPSNQIVSAVMVNESNAGETLELYVGDSIIIKLASNPTTGFNWQLTEITNESVLSNADQKFRMPAADPPPGAAGEEIWTFKAIGSGTSTLYMEYSRPWEGGEKGVETFSLSVVVKGDGTSVVPTDPSENQEKWNLISLGEENDPQLVIESTEITIEITEDDDSLSVSGSAGCNSYFGSFEVTEQGLKSGMIGSTEMWCMDKGVMDQETEYLKALGAVTSYEIDGDTLKMIYANGVLIFINK